MSSNSSNKLSSLIDPLVEADPQIAKWPRQWLGMHLAQSAVMLEDSQKVLKNDREAVKAHQSKVKASVAPAPEEEAGMIHVGDLTQHIHQAAPAQAPSPAKKAGIGKAAVAALTVAALLATGGGGAAVAAYLLTKAPAAVADVAHVAGDVAHEAVAVYPLEEQEMQSDGTWKGTGRRMLKDGSIEVKDALGKWTKAQ